MVSLTKYQLYRKYGMKSRSKDGSFSLSTIRMIDLILKVCRRDRAKNSTVERTNTAMEWYDIPFHCIVGKRTFLYNKNSSWFLGEKRQGRWFFFCPSS
jgi:hypothetical protein